MATKDKIVNLEDLKVLSDHVEGEVTDLKSDLNRKVDIYGAKQVTPMNLSILDGYENLLNPSEFEDGKLMNAAGVLSDNEFYQTSPFIPVVPNTEYMYVGRQTETTDSPTQSTNKTRTIAYFDINKQNIGGSNTNVTYPITIPENTYYIRFSVNHTYQYIMLYAGNERKPYIAYNNGQYVVKDEYLPNYHDFVTMDDIKAQKEFVSLPMTTFMYYSKNKVDPSTLSNGYINQATGNFSQSDSYRCTDFIAVNGNTSYCFTGANHVAFTIRICWYNESKTFISGQLVALADVNNVLVSPENAKFVRWSVTPGEIPLYMAAGDSVPTFEAFGSGYVKSEYMPKADLTNEIINLPKKIYAYVGYELNIYFENLVEDWEQYHWDVTCTKGRQMERGYNITPTASDVGTYEITIKMYLSDTVFKSVSASLIISATSNGSGTTKKVIILGDSTTNNGIAVTKLNENFANDSMHIATLGTIGTAPNNHEGRSGWRFSSYFQPSTDQSVQNPWYNPTSQTFDASYYFSNTGIAIPDWIFINLGINDTFGFENDTACENGITSIVSQCNEMIASIKSASSSIKIGLCLTIPPNHSQDAFGKAYQCGQTRDRYKRNNVMWVSRLISEYDGKENDRIYLIPIYTNLDTVNNMGLETLSVNARNTAITYQSPIGNGGVHPVESGYWQIADVYTAFLKAQA